MDDPADLEFPRLPLCKPWVEQLPLAQTPAWGAQYLTIPDGGAIVARYDDGSSRCWRRQDGLRCCVKRRFGPRPARVLAVLALSFTLAPSLGRLLIRGKPYCVSWEMQLVQFHPTWLLDEGHTGHLGEISGALLTRLLAQQTRPALEKCLPLIDVSDWDNMSKDDRSVLEYDIKEAVDLSDWGLWVQDVSVLTLGDDRDVLMELEGLRTILEDHFAVQIHDARQVWQDARQRRPPEHLARAEAHAKESLRVLTLARRRAKTLDDGWPQLIWTRLSEALEVAERVARKPSLAADPQAANSPDKVALSQLYSLCLSRQGSPDRSEDETERPLERRAQEAGEEYGGLLAWLNRLDLSQLYSLCLGGPGLLAWLNRLGLSQLYSLCPGGPGFPDRTKEETERLLHGRAQEADEECARLLAWLKEIKQMLPAPPSPPDEVVGSSLQNSGRLRARGSPLGSLQGLVQSQLAVLRRRIARAGKARPRDTWWTTQVRKARQSWRLAARRWPLTVGAFCERLRVSARRHAGIAIGVVLVLSLAAGLYLSYARGWVDWKHLVDDTILPAFVGVSPTPTATDTLAAPTETPSQARTAVPSTVTPAPSQPTATATELPTPTATPRPTPIQWGFDASLSNVRIEPWNLPEDLCGERGWTDAGGCRVAFDIQVTDTGAQVLPADWWVRVTTSQGGRMDACLITGGNTYTSRGQYRGADFPLAPRQTGSYSFCAFVEPDDYLVSVELRCEFTEGRQIRTWILDQQGNVVSTS